MSVVHSTTSVPKLQLSRMGAAHRLLPHLKTISLELPSCTLLSKDGSRLEVLLMPYFFKNYPCQSLARTSCSYMNLQISFFPNFQVQAHLLSLLSPFLAALLAQAGPNPAISLPCSGIVLRSLSPSHLIFLSYKCLPGRCLTHSCKATGVGFLAPLSRYASPLFGRRDSQDGS